MSFGGPEDPLLLKSVQAAHAHGVIMVAAAGNEGPRAAPDYPAAYPEVIAVTATDDRDQIYQDANHGNYIAVAAPGVDVLVPAPNGGYGMTTGTSVAAAHVSGVAALLVARNRTIKADAVRQILLRSAHAIGPLRDDTYGAGIADAYQAIMTMETGIAAGVSASNTPAKP
jgi:subtilisin family serine protease